MTLRPRLAALLLLLPLAGSARAQFEDAPAEQDGQEVEQVDEAKLIADMRERIAREPEVADALAARIARSTIADKVTGAADPRQRLAEIRAWIDKDPASAAGLGVGLAKDDANGTRSFERMVTRTLHNKLQMNPNAKNGIYGRLKKNSKDSKLMKAQSEEISDEEKRELLKTMFEGQGGQSNKIVTQQDSGRGVGQEPSHDAGPALNSAYYDRLSRGNLKGYSPELQTMQSSLNARRVPGAPKLIETGKLDFETLSYPSYGMRYDIANLEKRLRYERNYVLAKYIGEEGKYTPEQLLDQTVEGKLESRAGGASLSPRFKKRYKALELASAAARDFLDAAKQAKNPDKISRDLLLSLAAKQKEAARWITVASLQEELLRLDTEAGFLTADLLKTVDNAPIDAATRGAYKRRGEGFHEAIKNLKAGDEAAVAALESADWFSHVASIDETLLGSSRLRKGLSRNIQDYQTAAYQFAATRDLRPEWRRIIDGYLARFMPRSSYIRGLSSAKQRGELFKDVFMKIAAGDLDAAHTVLASYQPGAQPPKR